MIQLCRAYPITLTCLSDLPMLPEAGSKATHPSTTIMLLRSCFITNKVETIRVNASVMMSCLFRQIERRHNYQQAIASNRVNDGHNRSPCV